MLYSVKGASSGCTTDVLTYLSISYLYECTQKKITCKFGVDTDAEFSESFKASQNSPDSKV